MYKQCCYTRKLNKRPKFMHLHRLHMYELLKRTVSNLRQVGGFLWVLLFSPPIKLTVKI